MTTLRYNSGILRIPVVLEPMVMTTGSVTCPPLPVRRIKAYATYMTPSDSVFDENYYNPIDSEEDEEDFVAKPDVRLNIIVTFNKYCEFEPKSKITINTIELQKLLKEEFTQEQKRIKRLQKVKI